MPLRIAIVASLTLAACMIVPFTVNAVSPSSGANDAAVAGSDEPDSSDPVPISEPAGADDSVHGTAGYVATVTVAKAAGAPGYPRERSLASLGLLILAGFLPALMMMLRSSQRRRAGPHLSPDLSSDRLGTQSPA